MLIKTSSNSPVSVSNRPMYIAYDHITAFEIIAGGIYEGCHTINLIAYIGSIDKESVHVLYESGKIHEAGWQGYDTEHDYPAITRAMTFDCELALKKILRCKEEHEMVCDLPEIMQVN